MRNQVTLTVAAGTVKRLVAKDLPPVLALDLIITPLKGGTGSVDVLNFDPSTDPADNAQSLVTQLGPATATAAALPYRIDRSGAGAEKILLNEWGIDGSHTGDTVSCSWEPSR